MPKPSLILLLVTMLSLSGCTERRQERLLAEGNRMISEARYVKAVELFRRSVAMDPQSEAGIKGAYRLGFLLETYFKDYKGALIAYEEFVKHSREPARVLGVLRRIGSIQMEQVRNYDAAIQTYRRLLKENPDSGEADDFFFQIGAANFQLNRFAEARRVYQTLLERYPKSRLAARTRFEIGNTYYMEERYALALEAFKQVLRRHQQSNYANEAQFLMARCLEQQQKFDEALRLYQGLVGRYTPDQILSQRIDHVKRRVARK